MTRSPHDPIPPPLGTPDMRPVENAAGFYAPEYRQTLPIGRPLDARQAIAHLPADRTLLGIVDVIEACVMKEVREPGSDLGFAVSIGVANGVTAVQDRLTGEVERMRAAMLRAADTLAPKNAPSCFEPKPELIVAMAKALRDEAEVEL